MSLCRLIYKLIEIPLINQTLFLFFIIDNQVFLLPHVWKLLEKPKSIPRLADREVLCDNWIWMTVLYEKAILNYRFWNDLLNGLSLLNGHQMAFLWPTWFWENTDLVYDGVVLPHVCVNWRSSSRTDSPAFSVIGFNPEDRRNHHDGTLLGCHQITLFNWPETKLCFSEVK